MSLNILFITEGPVPAGYRNSRTHYIAKKATEKYNAFVITPTSYESELESFGNIYALLKKYDLYSIKDRIAYTRKSYLLAKKIIKNNKIDVIHGQGFLSDLITVRLGSRFEIPTVCGLPDFSHDLYYSFNFPLPSIGSRLLKHLDTWIAKNTTALIVESKHAKNIFVSRGVDANKIYPLWHCTNLKIFNLDNVNKDKVTEIKAKYGLEGKKVVLYHGDVGYDDGVDVLIGAAKKVLLEIKNVKFLIVGNGGSYTKKLEEYIKKLNLHDHFILTGWQPYLDIPNFIACCDVGVSPFRSTVYTNTVFATKTLEYMAMRRPVISSKLEAFSTVFKDNEHVLYTPPGDSDQLARRLVEVLGSPDKYANIVKNARKIVEERFDWGVISEKEVEVIESITNRVF